MTEEYQQDGINLVAAEPIVLQTESTDDVDILLGVLTADGQTMTVSIFGTGSKPSDVESNNYIIDLIVLFAREDGSGDAPIEIVSFSSSNGDSAAFSVTTNDTNGTTKCFLRLTPDAAGLYNHRLSVQRTVF